jgi:large subunit ribosomal protein L30
VAKRKGDEGSHNPAEKERPKGTAAKRATGNAADQPPRKPATGARIRVKQVRSLSGRPDKHRRTIEALGLKHTQHAVEHDDTPAIRGMVQQVIHLVSVEPAE